VRVLLTGAGGQLGQAVEQGWTGHEIMARTRAELDIVDLAAVRSVLESVRPDLVVNAAAYNAVDGAESDPEGAFAANAVGPRHLALATAERDLPLVHVSSDYVFDGCAGRAYHEFDETSPCSVYGRSKLAGEDAVRAHNPRHQIVRTAWLYSPVGRNFALTMRSLAGRGEVRVVCDQFGSPTYVPHLSLGLERLAETGVYGTFHLASAGVASWYDLARALFRELGLGVEVLPIPTSEYPTPAARPPFSALVSLQQPRIDLPSWHDGVKEFAAALRVRIRA
jgi:dTDP-4-dehydrorhamnose reductase